MALTDNVGGVAGAVGDADADDGAGELGRVDAPALELELGPELGLGPSVTFFEPFPPKGRKNTTTIRSSRMAASTPLRISRRVRRRWARARRE